MNDANPKAKNPEKPPKFINGNRFDPKHPRKAPMGLKWVRAFDQGSEKDKKNNKVTLENIAFNYGIHASDLMYMNWYTTKRSEVNWYLWEDGVHHPGDGYYFKKTDHPGMILVPEIIDSTTVGPLPEKSAVRNGAATINTQLMVQVVEWLPDGTTKQVSGKWLYVFSGDGFDFGYQKPSPPQGEDTAFSLDFPEKLSLTKKPNKLEYEIYITPTEPPSNDVVETAFGKGFSAKPRYEYHNTWYFLDSIALDSVTSEPRSQRTAHAKRPIRYVPVDPFSNGAQKRYYFLLSPIQLGPEGLNNAMANPSGLTPLIQRNWMTSNNEDSWRDYPEYWHGPDSEKAINYNPMTLRVIDPFAWAENLSHVVFPTAMNEYSRWINSTQNDVASELGDMLLWKTSDDGTSHLRKDGDQSFKETLEIGVLAQLLSTVMQNYSKGSDMREELSKEFAADLKTWTEKVVQRTEALNVAQHKAVARLIDWLEGPAHAIIETTILKDTAANKIQDLIDLGCSAWHSAICLDTMFPLKPGAAYIRYILNKKGRVPYDVVLKHFQGLSSKDFKFNLTDAEKTAFKFGHVGVLILLGLSGFTEPLPPDVANTAKVSVDKAHEQSAEGEKIKMDNIVKFFNEQGLLPIKLEIETVEVEEHGGSLQTLGGILRKGKFFSYGATFLGEYVIAKSLIPGIEAENAALTFSLNQLNQLYIYNGPPKLNQIYMFNEPEIRKTFEETAKEIEHHTHEIHGIHDKIDIVKTIKYGISWAFSFFELYESVKQARHDYEIGKGVNKDKLFLTSAEFLKYTYDVLSSVGELTKNHFMQKIFPDVEKVGAGLIKREAVTIGGKALSFLDPATTIIAGYYTIVELGESHEEAYSLRNYTAETYFRLAQVGAGMAIAGGVLTGAGLVLAYAGYAVAFIPGIGAFLVIAGTLIALFFAWLGGTSNEKDPYIQFARRCFFHRMSLAPYGEKPPSWSLTNGESVWTIAQQTKALLCLLGTPAISTDFEHHVWDAQKMTNRIDVKFKVTPGFSLTGWNTIEVALSIRKDGVPTTVRSYKGSPIEENYSIKKLSSDGKLFRAENFEIEIVADPKTKEPKEINITVKQLAYDVSKDIKWGKNYERPNMDEDPNQGLWGTLTFESNGSGISTSTEMQVCRISENGLDALKTQPSDLAEPERTYKSLQ